jgi:hypothetical protein
MLSQRKLAEFKHIKPYDYNNLNYYISGDDFCYENQHINRQKSMGFKNHIPNERGESGRLDLPFFIDFGLTPGSLIR